MRRILVLACALALSGCMEPVVIMGNGLLLKGTADIELTGSSFSATDGKLTCTGTQNIVVTTADPGPDTGTVTCSDGRKGIVVVNSNSGTGHIRLTDGTEADFIVGPAAQPLMGEAADAAPAKAAPPPG
jgi:hypothetical protein